MLALRFTFPTGRYHANPWGRHVNEGDVAWPPEPWRLLRALIATWHHKLANQEQADEQLFVALLEQLAASPPHYTLPPANHSHTRHYLPQWKARDTSLVFDAFAAVDRQSPLYCIWPDVELSEEQLGLLDTLLENLGYLGRAESWVEARRVDDPPEPNCVPGDEAVDKTTGEVFGEVVELQAPLSPAAYSERRQHFLSGKKPPKKLVVTLPEQWLNALCVESVDLQKAGWNLPPAARKISYVRPMNALRPVRRPRQTILPTVKAARFLVVGKPLPRVEESLRIGELVRRAVMSRFGRDKNGNYRAPPQFSGHGLPTDNRHEHAFYLPWDADGDGRIDRVLIHVPAGFGAEARHAIEGLCRIWQPGGHEWRLILESIGDDHPAEPLSLKSLTWKSLTPYLHPWHAKKGFGVEEQLRRECRERGLPELIDLERHESIEVGRRQRRSIYFQRFRAKRGLQQPDRLGGFWWLTFAEPVEGPLALGFGCHFGLGLFKPTD